MPRKKTKKDEDKGKKEYSEGVRKRMQNLVQYRGEEKAKSKEKADKGKEVLPMTAEEARAELLKIEGAETLPAHLENPSQTIPVASKIVLKKEEYKLYLAEVLDWYTSHPDWNMKEDIDDIHGIAMEKVIQFRLMRSKKYRPSTNIEKEYNSSIYRMQTFRQNLAARRADRISGKGNTINNQTNIAIIASNFDAEKMQNMKQKVVKLEEEEDDLFEVIDQ